MFTQQADMFVFSMMKVIKYLRHHKNIGTMLLNIYPAMNFRKMLSRLTKFHRKALIGSKSSPFIRNAATDKIVTFQTGMKHLDTKKQTAKFLNQFVSIAQEIQIQNPFPTFCDSLALQISLRIRDKMD